MNEKWTKKYKKSIDCSNPKGFSQKAHCAGRKKRQQGESIMSKSVNEQKLVEIELFLEKNVPTNPSKWSYYKSQAKKKFDVYPSAYANAWAAKMYKKAGGGWRTKKESIDEFQRDRQLRDPKKEMLIVKNGKVIVIDKKDFDKYRRKGWMVAEGLDENKNIKVTFRSKAAKQRYMKKQSLQPNSKEIVSQTDTSLTLTPDMKDYVSKKSHGDLIYQVESVNEGKVHFEKKLKSGNIFQVVDRDTKGMRGKQDKFQMQIVDKKGKVVKHIGSHPSLSGAKKFSNSVNEGKITKTFKFPRKTSTDIDEIDADFSRQGIQSNPDFNNNTVTVTGDENKIKKIVKFHRGIEESVNERYRPNLESKGWEAAQKVIRQLQSSVFRKLDDDELLEFRKAIADAFNLDGILK